MVESVRGLHIVESDINCSTTIGIDGRSRNSENTSVGIVGISLNSDFAHRHNSFGSYTGRSVFKFHTVERHLATGFTKPKLNIISGEFGICTRSEFVSESVVNLFISIGERIRTESTLNIAQGIISLGVFHALDGEGNAA